MLGLDDINGDGVRDFAIGATHSYTQKGYVRIYSGQNNALLRVLWGEVVYAQLGYAIAQSDDLDGDGVRDLLVGAPAWSAGQVLAYSPVTGVKLWEALGTSAGDAFGTSLAGLDDFNGDGIGDVLVGAPGASSPGAGSGAVHVLSGADGATVRVLSGFVAGDAAGQSVARLGDVDGDGRGDFAVGAPGADPGGRTDAGLVQVRSGANLAPLYSCDGASAGDAFGTALAVAGDVNGDGVPDLVSGAENATGGGVPAAGAALLCSGQRLFLHPDAIVVSAATGGRVEFSIDVGPGQQNRTYWIVGSASGMWPGMQVGQVHVPLNPDSFFDLVVGLTNTPLFDGFLGTLDGNGRATGAFDTLAPFDPAWAGLQFHFAFVLLNPLDTASNAVPIELMP